MAREMPPPEQIICKGPGCQCPVGTTEEYCSEECRLLARSEHPAEQKEEVGCACIHDTCGEEGIA